MAKTNIAERVYLIDRWSFGTHKSSEYRIVDSCYDPNCGFDIEFVSEDNCIEMKIHSKVCWRDWWEGLGFFRRWWERIKASCKVLFKGELDCHEIYSFVNKEHVDSFLAALDEGSKHVWGIKESEWYNKDVKINDYEKTFDEFWADIVLNSLGEPNIDQIKRELHDARIFMQEGSLVYDNITGGKFSKVTTDHKYIIEAAQEYYEYVFKEQWG